MRTSAFHVLSPTESLSTHDTIDAAQAAYNGQQRLPTLIVVLVEDGKPVWAASLRNPAAWTFPTGEFLNQIMTLLKAEPA